MRSISTYIGLLRRKGFCKCLCNLTTYIFEPSIRHARKLYKDYKELILSPLPSTSVYYGDYMIPQQNPTTHGTVILYANKSYQETLQELRAKAKYANKQYK